MVDLDDVDRQVLHQLQLDARNVPASEIAEYAGVSSSTVRNRIEKLESERVIEGYHPKLNYERAGLPLQLLFVCSAPPRDRADLAEAILDVRGVVDVRETVTGRQNIHVVAVGTDASDTVRVTDALHDAGVSIESSEIVREHHVQPFNHFGVEESHDVATEERARESTTVVEDAGTETPEGGYDAASGDEE